jgi:hypothetical protein
MLKMLQLLVNLYARVKPNAIADMQAHLQNYERFTRTHTVGSCELWDRSVREQAPVGHWSDGMLHLKLALHLEPKVHAQRQGGRDAGRPSPAKRRKGRGTCRHWAAGDKCTYSNCRFKHECPVCPGNETHARAQCPSKSDAAWDKATK